MNIEDEIKSRIENTESLIKYKESFIVGYADKYCSFFDAKKKVNNKREKLIYKFGVYVIMFMLTIF